MCNRNNHSHFFPTVNAQTRVHTVYTLGLCATICYKNVIEWCSIWAAAAAVAEQQSIESKHWPRSTSSTLSLPHCGQCEHACVIRYVRGQRACMRWLSIFFSFFFKTTSNQFAWVLTLQFTAPTACTVILWVKSKLIIIIVIAVNVQLWFGVRNYLTIYFWTPISTHQSNTEIKWLRSNVSIHFESQCHLHTHTHVWIGHCIATTVYCVRL